MRIPKNVFVHKKDLVNPFNVIHAAKNEQVPEGGNEKDDQNGWWGTLGLSGQDVEDWKREHGK